MSRSIEPNGTSSNSVTCRICGKTAPAGSSSRQKEYCSDQCREFYKYLSAMERKLDGIEFQDHAHAKKVKGDLFAIINGLHKKYPKGTP